MFSVVSHFWKSEKGTKAKASILPLYIYVMPKHCALLFQDNVSSRTKSNRAIDTACLILGP